MNLKWSIAPAVILILLVTCLGGCAVFNTAGKVVGTAVKTTGKVVTGTANAVGKTISSVGR